MEIQDALKIIIKGIGDRSSKSNKFVVVYKDGKRKDITFFIAGNGAVCYKKNARAHYGYMLHWWDAQDIVRIEVKKPFEASIKLVRKRAKEGVDMLTRSGLWGNFKKDFEAILKMSDSQIAQYIKDCKEDFYNLVYCDEAHKYDCIKSKEVMANLVRERCWVSVPFIKYSRSRKTMELEMKIREKIEHRDRWQNGYDCTIDTNFHGNDGISRAWLSMEFVGCGNGHYYALLDAKHAIHIEDD